MLLLIVTRFLLTDFARVAESPLYRECEERIPRVKPKTTTFMKARNGVVISSIILAAFTSEFQTSFAIEGLQIQVQCPNVVLSWPSVPGEVYIVRYQPAIGVPWTNLTTSLSAASGSTTTFTHMNGAPCPQVSGGGGGGSTNPPPAPGMAAPSTASVLSAYAEQRHWNGRFFSASARSSIASAEQPKESARGHQHACLPLRVFGWMQHR